MPLSLLVGNSLEKNKQNNHIIEKGQYYKVEELYKMCEENLEEIKHPNMSLKISSPYCNHQMFEKIYVDDGKNKWITKKGFNVNVKKKIDDFIPNYVRTTPGINPSEFKFREINKNLWKEKNGFSIKTGKDLLLKLNIVDPNERMMTYNYIHQNKKRVKE